MNDLRQTLTTGQQLMAPDQANLLTFHEKVDNVMEEQDILRAKHLQYLKEAAQLLTQEGELISTLQEGGDGSDGDIDEYVNRMEVIIARNLEIYSDMQFQIQRFKGLLNEEEEAHKKVGNTFYY